MKKEIKDNRQNSNYTRTGNNVYHDGYSYRVRVSVNGSIVSKNFPTKKAALAYRKELLQKQMDVK